VGATESLIPGGCWIPGECTASMGGLVEWTEFQTFAWTFNRCCFLVENVGTIGLKVFVCMFGAGCVGCVGCVVAFLAEY